MTRSPARCWSSRARTIPASSKLESRELVEHLRGEGKEVDYLMFEDEGHDVLKFPNRVNCYNTITSFFAQHLHP